MTEKKPSSTGRGVPILGPKLRSLRRQKGWTQLALARKAGCSERTIQTMERSGNVDIMCLHLVATALGVELATIRADEPTYSGSLATPDPNRKVVQFICSGDINQLNDVKLSQIVEKYREITGIKGGEFIVISVEEHKSYVLNVQIENQNILKCLASFLKNDLSSLGLKEILLPIGFGIWPILLAVYIENDAPLAMTTSAYKKRIFLQLIRKIFTIDYTNKYMTSAKYFYGFIMSMDARDRASVATAMSSLAMRMAESWENATQVDPDPNIPSPDDLSELISVETEFGTAVMELLTTLAKPDIIAGVNEDGFLRVARTNVNEYSIINE